MILFQSKDGQLITDEQLLKEWQTDSTQDLDRLDVVVVDVETRKVGELYRGESEEDVRTEVGI